MSVWKTEWLEDIDMLQNIAATNFGHYPEVIQDFMHCTCHLPENKLSEDRNFQDLKFLRKTRLNGATNTPLLRDGH
ncbi:hypothetical protein B5X24_HaOG215500 [Helicoverpa armigera]|nr:hypothetical protein B5X24_HaOG215500 [Helicoverpa armigera]